MAFGDLEPDWRAFVDTSDKDSAFEIDLSRLARLEIVMLAVAVGEAVDDAFLADQCGCEVCFQTSLVRTFLVSETLDVAGWNGRIGVTWRS